MCRCTDAVVFLIDAERFDTPEHHPISICRTRSRYHQAFHSKGRKRWTARTGAYGTTGVVCSFDEYLATPEGAKELLDFKQRVAARVEQDLQRLRERDTLGVLPCCSAVHDTVALIQMRLTSQIRSALSIANEF